MRGNKRRGRGGIFAQACFLFQLGTLFSACMPIVGLCRHLPPLGTPWHAHCLTMLDKLKGRFVPRPSAGPHKLRVCLPLVVIMQRLKVAATVCADMLSLQVSWVVLSRRLSTPACHMVPSLASSCIVFRWRMPATSSAVIRPCHVQLEAVMSFSRLVTASSCTSSRTGHDTGCTFSCTSPVMTSSCLFTRAAVLFGPFRAHGSSLNRLVSPSSRLCAIGCTCSDLTSSRLFTRGAVLFGPFRAHESWTGW